MLSLALILTTLGAALAASPPISKRQTSGQCPQPVITSPTSGSSVNGGIVTFTGTTSTRCPVIKVYTDRGDTWFTTADSTGVWSVSTGAPLGLRDGWLAAAEASPAGNDPTYKDLTPAQSTTTINFNVVNTCPAPVVTSPTNGQTVQIPDPFVTGTTSPECPFITLISDTGLSYTATAGQYGDWRVIPTGQGYGPRTWTIAARASAQPGGLYTTSAANTVFTVTLPPCSISLFAPSGEMYPTSLYAIGGTATGYCGGGSFGVVVTDTNTGKTLPGSPADYGVITGGSSNFNGGIPKSISLYAGSFTLALVSTTAGAQNYASPGNVVSSNAIAFTRKPAQCLAPAFVISGASTTYATLTQGVAASLQMPSDSTVTCRDLQLIGGIYPPGMALLRDAISGTPSAPGTFQFSMNRLDGQAIRSRGTGSLSITVLPAPPPNCPAPAFSNGQTAALATAGIAASYSLVADTCTQFSVTGSLPPGLTLSGSTISGTSSTLGDYRFTVTAIDPLGKRAPATSSFILTIGPDSCPVPAFGSRGGAPSLTYGTAVSLSLNAQTCTLLRVTAGALPPGLTLNNGGTISGIPTAVGSFSLVIAAIDPAGQYTYSSQAFTIVVNALQCTAPTLQGGGTVATFTGGTSGSLQLVSSGCTQFRVTGALPAGLSLSGDTIAGVTTVPGTYTLSVSAVSSSSNYAGSQSSTIIITVASPPPCPAPSTLSGIYGYTVIAGSPLTLNIASSGCSTFLVVSGLLPYGLSISGQTITGTPTTPASYNFAVAASDALGTVGASRYFVFTVQNAQCRRPTFAAGSLSAAGTVGTALSLPLSSTSSGCNQYMIVVGALPLGLSLDTAGTLAGTPTTSGTYTFAVVAVDPSASQTTSIYSYLTLTIANQQCQGPVITSPAANAVIRTSSVTFSGTIPAINVNNVGCLAQIGLSLVYPDSTTKSFSISINTVESTRDLEDIDIDLGVVSPFGLQKRQQSTQGYSYTVSDLPDGAYSYSLTPQQQSGTGDPFSGNFRVLTSAQPTVCTGTPGIMC